MREKKNNIFLEMINSIEKKSGIYRVFIKYKNKDFSYIGISKNIFSRWKTHKTKINSWYQLTNKKRFLEHLKNQTIPSKDAFYFKTTFFCYQNNLKPKDFQFEVLFEVDVKNIEIIEQRETKLINEYNSVFQGFNGAFAKLNKLVYFGSYPHPIELKLLEIAKEQAKTEYKTNLKELDKITKNIKLIDIYMIWSVWQLFCCEMYKFNNKQLKISLKIAEQIKLKWKDLCEKVYEVAKLNPPNQQKIRKKES